MQQVPLNLREDGLSSGGIETAKRLINSRNPLRQISKDIWTRCEAPTKIGQIQSQAFVAKSVTPNLLGLISDY